MTTTRATRLCLLAAAGCLGVAGYVAIRPTGGAEPPFVVALPAVDRGDLPLGSSTLIVTVSNPSDRPRRIIGMTAG